MQKTSAAIVGYGRLGRGVEIAVNKSPDIELFGVFTRRVSNEIKPEFSETRVYNIDSLYDFVGKINVLILCVGSASDLPRMTPEYARDFCVVDSFDIHAEAAAHYAAVDKAARGGGTLAVISSGWDPGLFSLARLYFSSALPCGESYTFWGKGVSQGHSEAIRKIEGVLDARQYTLPSDDALRAVRQGGSPSLSATDMHHRECYVVLKDGADPVRVEREIREMPHYFKGYETRVHFISRDELVKSHGSMAHGGRVIRCGRTGGLREHLHSAELSLSLESNPEFTACMLAATARAAHRLYLDGERGCKTLFDIPPRYLSPISAERLISELL